MDNKYIYNVYKITNLINRKIYIGYTSNIIKRKSAHKKSELNAKHSIGRAIAKYGWINFKFEVIYQSVDKEDALTIEKYFIKFYQSTNDKIGYNITTGGEAPEFSNYTKSQISKSLKQYYQNNQHPLLGFKHSNESRQQMSQSHIGKPGFNKGKCFLTAEGRKSMIAKARGKHRSVATEIPSKKIIILNYITQKIKIYDSLNKAARQLNCSPALICMFLKNGIPNSKKLQNYQINYYTELG